jgi:hypothetical protein
MAGAASEKDGAPGCTRDLFTFPMAAEAHPVRIKAARIEIIKNKRFISVSFMCRAISPNRRLCFVKSSS